MSLQGPMPAEGFRYWGDHDPLVATVWDPREPWFVSATHTDADVAETLEVFEVSLREEKG